jgi:hypothetical protein
VLARAANLDELLFGHDRSSIPRQEIVLNG